jgi:uncharacterized alpha-E superfamily protein
VARFVDVNQQLALDLPVGLEEQWKPLVAITGDYADFAARYERASKENVIQFLVFDTENPNSITSCLRAARENARSIREIISSEMWTEINQFYLSLLTSGPSRALESPQFFAEVKRSSHLIEGVTNATMAHNEAWHFIVMGRSLERADKTTRILDVKYFILLPAVGDVGTPVDDLHWSAVLRSASGFEMYRKRYGRLLPPQITKFLILDREFPRSVNYCAMQAEESLHAVTGTPLGTYRNGAERRLGQLVSELAYTDIGEAVAHGLHEFLDGLQAKLNEVGEEISDKFFAVKAYSQ